MHDPNQKSPQCATCRKPLRLLTDPWPDPVERVTHVPNWDRHEWAGQVCPECRRCFCLECTPRWNPCPHDGSLLVTATYPTLKGLGLGHETFVAAPWI